MSQKPQSAKRMRSNTSNTDFTPQTAPALRTRPHHHLSTTDGANIGLYSPTLYDTGFDSIPTGRPDVDGYGSYIAATQHNGYPAAAFAEAYDTHTHGNSYTIAYGQPPPNGYNAAYGGYHGQDTVSSVHSNSYSPMTARQSVGPESYSPSPIPGSSANTSYSDVQSHSTVHTPQPETQQQYDDVYATSSSVCVGMNHAQAVAYADPIMTTQYSTPTEQTAVEIEPQSTDITGSDGNTSDEDAQGETADEAELSKAKSSSKAAAIHISRMKRSSDDHASKHSESKCACKKGRGKKKACTSCACSKYGRKCGKHCSCGTACGNPFKDLTAFFGPSSKFPKVCDANACFATWLAHQPNVEELDLDLMVDMLLYDDASWASLRGQTKAFKEWEDRWTKTKNSKSKKVKEDRQRLEFELLRGALGNCNVDDFHGFWYSFCQGRWVPMDHWEHCRECKTCAPANEWHCEQHGQCTSDRICAGCTGSTPSYLGMATAAYTAAA